MVLIAATLLKPNSKSTFWGKENFETTSGEITKLDQTKKVFWRDFDYFDEHFEKWFKISFFLFFNVGNGFK